MRLVLSGSPQPAFFKVIEFDQLGVVTVRLTFGPLQDFGPEFFLRAAPVFGRHAAEFGFHLAEVELSLRSLTIPLLTGLTGLPWLAGLLTGLSLLTGLALLTGLISGIQPQLLSSLCQLLGRLPQRL